VHECAHDASNSACSRNRVSTFALFHRARVIAVVRDGCDVIDAMDVDVIDV
jgi:hypothetical protein